MVCLFTDAVADALDARKSPIIIDNTFVQQWERDQYIKLVSTVDLTALGWYAVAEC